MNRHTQIVLTISIVLNVLFAGMLLGDASRQLVATTPVDQAQLAQLPKDKRALYDAIMVPAKQKMDNERAQMDSEKKEALGILTAEPFNAKAYIAKIQHMNSLHVQMKREMAEAVVLLAEQLTPQERAALAEIISHPPFAMPSGTLRQNSPPQQ